MSVADRGGFHFRLHAQVVLISLVVLLNINCTANANSGAGEGSAAQFAASGRRKRQERARRDPGSAAILGSGASDGVLTLRLPGPCAIKALLEIEGVRRSPVHSVSNPKVLSSTNATVAKSKANAAAVV